MMMSTGAYPTALLVIHVLWFLLLDTCSGQLILEVSPYPARIYEGAPPDVPVLTVRGYDNSTGLPVTSFTLDNNYFKIDSSGIIKTSQTINFAVGRVFQFMVTGTINNHVDYKHVQIIVSVKNRHPPRFNLPDNSFSIYRYGVGSDIMFLNVTDDDVEAYNNDITLLLDTAQPDSKYVYITPDGYLRLQPSVPDQITALKVIVWATDSGSPQYTSSAEVNINIANVREPYIFCLSSTYYAVILCWKNPMPLTRFDGYNVTVSKGGINRTVSLPAIDEHTEACYSVNDTGFNISYVFKVVIRTHELTYGGDFQIIFNKNKLGHSKRCLTEGFSICSYNTTFCKGHGSCINTSPTNHSCLCDPGWQGRNCESQDMCVSSPCLNNAICKFTGHQNYSCQCPDVSFYGLNCQYYNQCVDEPCQNAGTCMPLDNGTYSCECVPGFTGEKCQIQDPCSPSPCTANRGICKAVSGTEFTCECSRGYYGDRCEYIDACLREAEPCNYQGTCIRVGDSFTCVCPLLATGDRCRYLNPCYLQPCLNSGNCTNGRIPGTYVCLCLPGYYGNECQNKNHCFGVNCNHGECKLDSPLTPRCECDTGYHGDYCDRFDVCLTAPCQNQGTCVSTDPTADSRSNFTCSCTDGWSGVDCSHPSKCSLDVCKNGGTCVDVPGEESHCICGDGNYLSDCSAFDPCSRHECQNGALCRNVSQDNFTCQCQDNWLGELCEFENPCSQGKDPCENGGECVVELQPPPALGTSSQPSTESYLPQCICQKGYIGKNCQTSDPCISSPCVHGDCLIDAVNNTSDLHGVDDAQYVCSCQKGYTGKNCQTSDPCISSPCVHGDCLIDAANKTGDLPGVDDAQYVCSCQKGYTGKNCQISDPCISSPCVHGDCLIDAANKTGDLPGVDDAQYVCSCQKGYTGKNCQISDPCISSPCVNGDCRTDAVNITSDLPWVGDAQYVCSCQQNFTGRLCDLPVNLCEDVRCLNGGYCREGICVCPSSFTGSRCEQELPVCTDMGSVDAAGQTCVVDETMKNLQGLLDNTSEPSRLTIAQVMNFTDQLINLYNHTLRDPRYAWTAFCVIGNLAKVNVSVCEMAERANNASTRLRDFVDDYAAEVKLDDVSGQINITSPEMQVKAVAVRKLLQTGNDTFSFQPYVSDNNTRAEINMEIKIPFDILTNMNNETADTRLQFIGYRRSQLFVPDAGFPRATLLYTQPVISATLKGREVKNLTRPVEIHLLNTTAGSNYTCVFWDSVASRWSSEGLTMVSRDPDRITCTSTHLTSFAILLNVNDEQTISQKHELILTYLTYIGCAISTSCLVFTIITYAMFKCLNNEKSGKILIQLCAALLLLNVTFLAATVDVSNYNEEACLTVGILLHYFVLASLMWMLAEAVEMYQALVTVFSKYETLYLVKRCLLAWGIPIIIVAITAGVDSESYYGEKDTRNFCFLTSKSTVAYYTSLVAPSCAILLINIFVFIMVARVILKPNFQQQIMNNTTSITPAQVRGAFTVMFLLGITWVFGPLAVNEAQTAFSYLFCICNSLQGFLIFVFRCLFNPEAKLAWLQLFYMGTLKRKRGPIKSVYTDSTSKGGDNRRHSTSNTSGFLGSGTMRTTLSKSGNGFHPHPHQLHTTNGWHPNLNGLKRDKTQKEGSGSLGSRDYSPFDDQKRKLSSEYSPTTKRQSLTNESTETLQDEQTHF